MFGESGLFCRPVTPSLAMSETPLAHLNSDAQLLAFAGIPARRSAAGAVRFAAGHDGAANLRHHGACLASRSAGRPEGQHAATRRKGQQR